MNFEHKRRAIFTGLYPFFDEDGLEAAVKLWEKEYAFKPDYGYSEFLSQIARTKAKRLQRMKMLASIFFALEQPEHKLMQVTFDPVPKATTSNKRTLVFESFVNNLLDRVQGTSNQLLRSSLIQAIPDLGLNVFDQDALGQYLDKESFDLKAELDVITMRQLVRLIDKNMKQLLGAQQAMQSFTDAVHATQLVSQEYGFDLQAINK